MNLPYKVFYAAPTVQFTMKVMYTGATMLEVQVGFGGGGRFGRCHLTSIQSRIAAVTAMSEDEQAELENKTINEEYKTWYAIF